MSDLDQLKAILSRQADNPEFLKSAAVAVIAALPSDARGRLRSLLIRPGHTGPLGNHSRSDDRPIPVREALNPTGGI